MAGGNLGPHIVNALLAADFTVTIFSRTESSFQPPPEVTAAGAAFCKLDFSEAALSQALRGQDAVIATVAKDRDAILSQRVIIDAAVSAGVRRLVPAEFGSYTEDTAVVERLPIFKSKLAVLDHLKAVSAKNPHFSYTAICNGAFFDWGLTSTFLGFDLASRHATLYSHGLATFNATTLPTVARAVANALLLPLSPLSASAHNRFFCIAELRTRQIDVLAALQREIAEAKTGTTAMDEERHWVVSRGRDAEEMRVEGLRSLKEGVAGAASRVVEAAQAKEGAAEMLILGDLFGQGVGTVGLERVRSDNRALDVKMRDVGDVVREVVTDWVG
ncbi:MAG: hypothetical protein Q9161_008724 [Pseudevernia consocians]